jgi:hypothetical protein
MRKFPKCHQRYSPGGLAVRPVKVKLTRALCSFSANGVYPERQRTGGEALIFAVLCIRSHTGPANVVSSLCLLTC